MTAHHHALTPHGLPAVKAVRLPVLCGSVVARRAEPPAAPPDAHAGGRLRDAHGRLIQDLRLSITDRCNFRCVYCLEPGAGFLPTTDLLAKSDFIELASAAASLGVRKVRITGGEPSLHPGLEAIIAGIREETNLEIAIITNGSRLDRTAARRWRSAGLDRVTISLDSLKPERFARLIRSRTSVGQVFRAIDACLDEGLTPLKINAVLVRGYNDDEGPELAGLARRLGVEVRFIEYMPLDSGSSWDPSLMVSNAQTQAAIDRHYPLAPDPSDDPSSTARCFRFADGSAGRVGFVSPMTSPFCGQCSRLRITADGRVRPCLFSTEEWDIAPLLRDRSGRDAIRAFLVDAAWAKGPGHQVGSSAFTRPARSMSAIGG